MHSLASSIFDLPGGATWTDVYADLISAAIGGVIVFIWKERIMRLMVRWWRRHAGPGIDHEVHTKIGQMHALIEELRDHLGNGYLDDVHLKLDGLEDKFRAVVQEDVVPLLIPVEQQEE